MQTFGEKFGALIKERRGLMSLADVARLAFTQDGTGRDVDAEARKSDVKQIEDGLTAKPHYATIKAFQQALDISDAEIAALRTPTEQSTADRLQQLIKDADKVLGEKDLPEPLVVALAERIADSVADYPAALAELADKLDVADKRHALSTQPSNHDALIDEIFAKVDDYTRAGDLDAGAATLEDALEAHKVAQAKLLDGLIDQHTLRRDAPATAAALLDRFDIDHAGDPASFSALRTLQDDYYVLGRDKGLPFDMEVSIALAHACISRATDNTDKATALNDLAISLQTLGAREEGTARLEEAVTAFRNALEVHTRADLPIAWAMTQNNLGNALRTLGAREEGTARLEEAVSAYRNAMEVRTRADMPYQWAQTQENLALVYRELHGKTQDPAHLDTALTAVTGALEVFTAAGADFYITKATRLRDDIRAEIDAAKP